MNETIMEVEYSKAKLYKRWFAFLIDLMLMFLVGMIFYSLSSFIAQKTPSYSSSVIERQEIQKNVSIYDSDGNLIILTVSKSDDPYEKKKDILNTAIEDFYHNPSFFSQQDNTYYAKYQERKKEAKTDNGTLLFERDENTDNCIEKENILAKDYFQFYSDEIEKYLVGYLSLNQRYQDITNYLFRVTLYCLIVSMTLSFLLFFLAMPMILRRGRQTVGMYLFKISLISADALNLTLKQFLIRFLFEFFIGYLLSLVTFGLPLLVSLTMMHLSKTGQDFFDYMTNTYVIDSSKKDVYLDYSEFEARQDLSSKASIEDKDFRMK